MSFLQSAYGFLSMLPWPLQALIVVVLVGVLGYRGARLWIWVAVGGVLGVGLGAPSWLAIPSAALAVLFLVPFLRRALLTKQIMRILKRKGFLPVISETEKEAIDAGTVWVEAELFGGRPNFRKISKSQFPKLTDAESAFLDGPVEEVCRMTDDWQVYQDRDLPPNVWHFLKSEYFFGMIIPKEYGGLGFSALANSAVIAKLASRSLPLAVTVMVPNSLGPAELLVHYGTQEQKDYYLPRLAGGIDIPCFALTEPKAGSDAGAIQASGRVRRGDDGELYLHLSWNKRYITLASISTVLGLAFRLWDPENLLQMGEDLGIACALIPTQTEGVIVDRRHDPLGIPFYNSPTEGRDVIVPFDAVIGGMDGVGWGWQMLMECLAAGRGISVPATSTGGAQLVARAVGAHAAIRKQFGVPIGRFGGVEEPLARIGGFTYMLEAARRFTCGGLDTGNKPAVVTAMAKYNSTEMFRQVINDGMDVMAGNGICQGPRNLLANPYIGAPITITVEGANILTRTLMIFGQGSIRCHPFAYKEIKALEENDVVEFDHAIWGHARHLIRNSFRTVLLSLSRGRLASVPGWGPRARYYKKLAWASASFALLADVAMASLGGNLKRREKITGRFADILSCLYFGTATLHRFTDERQVENLPYMQWSMEYLLARIQSSFEGILQNLQVPLIGPLLRGPVLMWWRLNPMGTMPRDSLGGRVARGLQVPGRARDALTAGIYIPTDRGEALGRLEVALHLCTEAEGLLIKVKRASRAGQLPPGRPEDLLEEAKVANILNPGEVEKIRKAEAARSEAIAVDSFTLDEYLGVPETAPLPSAT
jgi:acyl-CoA dehydrogenase